MNFRLLGVVVVLSMLLLAVFARLAIEPSSLIVDADHPSVDHARPRDDPSIGNDLTRLFLPHHLAISHSLTRLGRVPQWDDRGFGGRPLVGNPQAGLFYPPVWVTWLTGSPASLGWITVAHLLWMGLGTYRLARTLKLGEWGSLVAAGCVQISPYVLGQTFEGHYPHVWAASWYPWAFAALVQLRRGDLARGLLLVPILAATLLTGHPQEGYYLLIAVGIWLSFDAITAISRHEIGPALRTVLIVAGLVILAIGLTGIELIPGALAQEWTLKGTKLNLRMASRYHAYPINLLQLLSPRALGQPSDYFGHENYWESVIAIGLIPLFLAAIGACYGSDRRLARGWSIVVVGSLLFAFGRKFGVFPLLFELVPGMDRFRVPARSLFLAGLGGSILAGLGVETLRVMVSPATSWASIARRSSIFAVVVVSLVLAVGYFPPSGSAEPTETDRLNQGLSRIAADPIFWVALTVVPATLVIGQKFASLRPIVAVILGLLGLVELGSHGYRLILTTPASRYFDSDPISEALATAKSPGMAPTRIRAVDALYDDLRAGRLGLEKTNVNDSFQIQHAADLYESLYHLFDADQFVGDAPMDRAVADYRREIRQGVLDRMGVDFLIDDRLCPKSTWLLIRTGEWRGSHFAVYRNSSAMPRAYVVPRVDPADDDRWLVDRFPRVDPHEAVLMPFDPLGSNPSVRQSFKPADWTSQDPDRIVLRVRTEAPGLLVITDTWMPGWSAVVDGEPAAIYRGNRSQRVVPLKEPGDHTIVLTYRTPGLAAGVSLTIVSASFWFTLAVFVVRAKLNRPFADGIDRGPPPPR